MRPGDGFTRLGGSGIERRFDAITEALRRTRIVDSPTVKAEYKTHGVILTVKPGKGGSAPPGNTSRAQIISSSPDYWVCTLVSDGSTINVAKPWKLRRTPFDAQTIGYEDEEGNSYTEAYGYLSDFKRNVTVTSGGDFFVEPQVIIPRVKLGFDYIFVASTEETGVTDAEDWVDINNDGRYWAKL